MKALLQNQYHAAECHLRASTWLQGRYGLDTYAQAAAVKEQVRGAYFSEQVRKGLEIENALRAIEICLQG